MSSTEEWPELCLHQSRAIWRGGGDAKRLLPIFNCWSEKHPLENDLCILVYVAPVIHQKDALLFRWRGVSFLGLCPRCLRIFFPQSSKTFLVLLTVGGGLPEPWSQSLWWSKVLMGLSVSAWSSFPFIFMTILDLSIKGLQVHSDLPRVYRYCLMTCEFLQSKCIW